MILLFALPQSVITEALLRASVFIGLATILLGSSILAYFSYIYLLDLCSSQCGSQAGSIGVAGSLLEMQSQAPPETDWIRSHIGTRSLGDSYLHQCLRRSGTDEQKNNFVCLFLQINPVQILIRIGIILNNVLRKIDRF